MQYEISTEKWEDETETGVKMIRDWRLLYNAIGKAFALYEANPSGIPGIL